MGAIIRMRNQSIRRLRQNQQNKTPKWRMKPRRFSMVEKDEHPLIMSQWNESNTPRSIITRSVKACSISTESSEWTKYSEWGIKTKHGDNGSTPPKTKRIYRSCRTAHPRTFGTERGDEEGMESSRTVKDELEDEALAGMQAPPLKTCSLW